eukprot:361967-Chlamydomonas_euryale.AAC.3
MLTPDGLAEFPERVCSAAAASAVPVTSNRSHCRVWVNVVQRTSKQFFCHCRTSSLRVATHRCCGSGRPETGPGPGPFIRVCPGSRFRALHPRKRAWLGSDRCVQHACVVVFSMHGLLPPVIWKIKRRDGSNGCLTTVIPAPHQRWYVCGGAHVPGPSICVLDSGSPISCLWADICRVTGTLVKCGRAHSTHLRSNHQYTSMGFVEIPRHSSARRICLTLANNITLACDSLHVKLSALTSVSFSSSAPYGMTWTCKEGESKSQSSFSSDQVARCMG